MKAWTMITPALAVTEAVCGDVVGHLARSRDMHSDALRHEGVLRLSHPEESQP